MRFLLKLLGWTAMLVVLASVAHSLLLWGAARRDYSLAEAQVADVIARGATAVTLKDVPALRHLPANLAEVEGLSRLQVRGSRVADLSILAGMTELEALDVFESRVSDLSPLTGLPKLKHVQIGRTRVRDLSPLATMPALERIGMNGVQVASLEPLTRVARLDWVNLHAAYAEDGSQEHYVWLTENVAEVNNGRAFRENYVPQEDWLWRVRMNRLAADFGLPEPFPRPGV